MDVSSASGIVCTSHKQQLGEVGAQRRAGCWQVTRRGRAGFHSPS